MKIDMTISADIDLAMLAKVFASMTDDEQSKFFVEVARQMGDWSPGAFSNQLWHIGRHLVECECSTPEAREFIEGIYSAMTHEKEKAA